MEQVQMLTYMHNLKHAYFSSSEQPIQFLISAFSSKTMILLFCVWFVVWIKLFALSFTGNTMTTMSFFLANQKKDQKKPTNPFFLSLDTESKLHYNEYFGTAAAVVGCHPWAQRTQCLKLILMFTMIMTSLLDYLCSIRNCFHCGRAALNHSTTVWPKNWK